MSLMKFPIFLLVYLLFYYCWLIGFIEYEKIRLIGSSVFSLVGSLIGLVWLIQAFLSAERKNRFFWLLLGSSACCYVFACSFNLYAGSARSLFSGYPDAAAVFKLFASAFFGLAFCFKIKLFAAAVPVRPFYFSIAVWISIIVAVALQYLISPVLQWADESAWAAAAHLLIGLSFLMLAAVFFYLAPAFRARAAAFTLTALLLQAAVHLAYLFFFSENPLLVNRIFEPLWLLPLLVAAAAGVQAPGYLHQAAPTFTFNRKSKYSSACPYIGGAALLVFVIVKNYAVFDFLSAGVAVLFLLMAGRQLVIVKKTEKLLEEYRYLAYHDSLTHLNNRALFKKDMEEILTKRNYQAALLLIDLDRFKGINDALGHQVGDSLLAEVSKRLQENLPVQAAVYRIGGDEFAVILSAIKTHSEVTEAAGRILCNLRKPIVIEQNELVVTPSIGISLYPEHGQDADSLFKHADAAMYLAKEQGKNRFQLYNARLHKKLFRKMSIELGLKTAAEKQELLLHYQPKVHLQTGEVIGVEALMRWNHPTWGAVAPAEFIAAAEESGQIILLGEWLLKEACEQAKKWQNENVPFVHISVNVAARQFQQNDFVGTVQKVLKETGLSPSCLELEVTERTIQHLNNAAQILEQLQSIGVRISIDDFGTGYSSLHVLKTLPVNTIKLDKSFIDDVQDPANQAVMKVITEIGMNLQLNVIAEGIETKEQANILLLHNCLYGQGYLFSGALPANEMKNWIAARYKKTKEHV